MAFTLNRRLAQLVDSNGQLNTGKIPNDYISSDHIADNVITASMLHTSFTVSTSNLTAIDTDDVSEGSTNLYFTNARADARIAAATTDDLTEGSTNLYYTDARAQAVSINNVVEDTTPQLGGDLASNGNDINFGDNDKAVFGAGSDLQIYHNGSHSFISEAGTGDLYIGASSNIALMNAAFSENKLLATTDGALNLYYDGLVKFATTNTGATVTGDLAVTGDLNITGNVNSYNVTDLDVTDKTITLGAGQIEANSGGSGIIIDGSGASILWDETNTEWDFNKNVNITGTAQAERIGANSTVNSNYAVYGLQNGSMTHAGYFQANGNDDIAIEAIASAGTYSGDVLYVQQSNVSTGGNLARFANSSGDQVVITTAGNVGIGTTVPNRSNFNIHGANRTLASTTSQVAITASDSIAADIGGSLHFGARYDTTTTDFAPTGYVAGRRENATVNNFAGYLQFGVTQGNAGTIEAMRITSTGNVGIGTDTPDGELHVLGTGGGNGDIYVERTSGAKIHLQAQSANGKIGTFSNHDLGLNTNGTTRVTIDTNGKVGIGTDSPPNLLSVRKTITAYEDVISIIGQNSPTDIMGALAYDQSTDLMIIRNDQTYATGGIAFRAGGTANHLFIKTGGHVGIGTSSPYKKLEVVGDIQLDATDANIWIKSGATGTNGFINWTFNTDSTVYNKIGMDYDTRASTGFHIDAGYPITIDASASGGKAINFDIGGVTKAVIDGTGNLGVNTTAPQSKLETNLHSGSDSSLMNANTVNDVHLIRAGFGQNAATTSNAGAKWGLRFVGRNDGTYDTGKSGAIFGVSEDSAGYNRKVGLAFHTSPFDSAHTERMRIDSDGNVGIANDNPSYLVDVGTAASTQSNIFRGTVNGDFIFTLAKNATNLFSIRNNTTSIVHLNTQNNATLALGVSSTNNTGTIEQQVRIYSNGTVSMTASSAGNGSSIFSTGAYGTSQGDNKTHFGYNNSGTYNNYIRGSTTIFSSRVKFDQPLSDSITIDGDNIDPYVYIDGSTNSRDSGVKINAGSGYVNTLRMDSGNNLYIHNNAIHINSSGRVIIANVNDDYSFKAMGGDTDSWFGVYDDANNSANIIVTRSDTTESFRHLGHTGETTIKANGTGLRIESTDNEALQIAGNGAGLNFQTGTNQRIYFNSYRAMEGSSNGASLQIGESYSVINLQGNTVIHGNLTPSANNAYDLGSSTLVWRDLYIGDLILSNETRVNDDGTTGNEIDGTTGNWTIQEGSDELYLINNKNGKKYKFVLQEIE
jgi:hypothetical protein